MKKLTKILVTAILGVFLVAGSSWATAMLDISGTGILGFQVSDSDADGIVNWSGTAGAFELAIAAGVTKPQIGSSSYPEMHLTGLATTSTGGTITIKFSEIDFGPLSGVTGFVSSLNGLSGVQSLDVYYDTSNAIFGEGTQIANITTLNTNEIYNGIPASNPFSMTMIATMSLGAAEAASFDNGVSPVPEPATIFLFGAGLLGLAAIGRKKYGKK